ncbi:hypothetical protein [Anderseniella sp. Alg231-50]|uniref:hypothetical protein n=1 Tax=Anderseniella sp. Alg231-50 TaxID=1922226 RepID=UPI00307C14EF
MTTIRNTAIAAVAAITIAAAMASPAHAISKKGAFWAGVGTMAAFGALGAAHGHGYYDHGYRGGRHYRRSARRCARRFGWHTWRWERCMARRGY